MSLIWKDLCFTGDEKILRKIFRGCLCVCCCPLDQPKLILDNLHGSIDLGQLTALMGPSG